MTVERGPQAPVDLRGERKHLGTDKRGDGPEDPGSGHAGGPREERGCVIQKAHHGQEPIQGPIVGIEDEGLRGDALDGWIEEGVTFALSLPPK